MIFISKKFIAAIACAAVLIIGASFSAAAVYGEKHMPTVVIDAGHGGADGGVVGTDGQVEARVNLIYAEELAKILRAKGYNVTLTRTDESSLGRNKKEDMAKRKQIIADSGAVAAISIHMNKYGSPSRVGTQVFYDDTGINRDFAAAMQDEINKKINAEFRSRSNYEAIGGDYFITKCTRVPTVIIECGFLSSPSDCALIATKEFRQSLMLVVAGVLDNIAKHV